MPSKRERARTNNTTGKNSRFTNHHGWRRLGTPLVARRWPRGANRGHYSNVLAVITITTTNLSLLPSLSLTAMLTKSEHARTNNTTGLNRGLGIPNGWGRLGAPPGARRRPRGENRGNFSKVWAGITITTTNLPLLPSLCLPNMPTKPEHSRTDNTITVGSETTMVGVVSGLHQGLGVGLGALVGGYAYAGLGPSLCFLACAALPCVSLVMLALPAVPRCLHLGGGNQRKGDMMDGEGLEGWGGADSRDIVVPVSTGCFVLYLCIDAFYYTGCTF